MAVTEAVENYLETILMLSQELPDVHAIDICSYLGYSRPTVSIVLRKMKEDGLVNVDGDNHITLTDQGRIIAERIYERHTTLADFFMLLGVSKNTAYSDACKLEHDLSDESYTALKNHYIRLSAEKNG